MIPNREVKDSRQCELIFNKRPHYVVLKQP